MKCGRLLAVASLTGLSLVAPVTFAQPAGASVKSQCTGQDRVLIRRVEKVSKKFRSTHVQAITLARGTGYSQSTTLEVSNTLTSSTDITAEVGGSADWGFASLSASVKATVAKEHSTTGKKTVKHTFTIHAVNHDRRFVLFSGAHAVTGRWHYLSCSKAPGHGVEKYGPIKSYYAADYGTVLCPHTRYKSSDYRHTIAVEGAC